LSDPNAVCESAAEGGSCQGGLVGGAQTGSPAKRLGRGEPQRQLGRVGRPAVEQRGGAVTGRCHETRAGGRNTETTEEHVHRWHQR